MTTLLVLTGLCSVSPVSAQGYHYGYGSSRVVNQNNIGLSNHDSSYISPGCISDSAKGVVRNGYRPNPLLLQVNLGRTVKNRWRQPLSRGRSVSGNQQPLSAKTGSKTQQ
ncbi:MAG: hypothetical protein R3D26_18165 [Cyanobacteriota/Melainabacteria group bacterium]